MSIAMEPTFVGEDRQTRLRSLIRLYDEVSRTGRSRLVVLAAPTGWGKTRIVRELYAHLARTSSGGYWPPSLDAGEGSWLEARKRVFPPPFDVPGDVRIPYVWLGVSCQRDQMGRELAGLQYAERQFEAHVGPMAAALEGSGDRWKSRLEAVGAIAGLFGLPDPVSLALTWQGIATSGWEMVTGEWRSIRDRRAGASARRIETHGGDGESERAVELAGQLARLSGEDLPVILVVDDAHWADPATVALLGSLLGEEAHLLIVATAWPDKLAVQATKPGTFGHALPAWIETGTAERHDLQRLPDETLDSLVRSVAPDTDPRVRVALCERADGNPNRLQGLMSLRIVRRALESGVALTAAQIEALPTGDAEIIQAIWRDLPEHVREVLALSTIQGSEFNPDWIPAAAELVDLADASTGLAQAQSPWGWVRSLDAALAAFVEAGLFERAEEESHSLFLPDELARAREAMLRWAADQRNRPDWETLSAAARRAVLEAHYLGADEGVLEVERGVIDSALELLELLVDRQELARARAVAERGMEWTRGTLRWADAWWVFRHELADVAGAQGDVAGALQQYSTLLPDHAEAFGRSSDPHLEVRSRYAWWLIVHGDYDDALDELDVLIRTWTERHGEDHEEALRARRRRGTALLKAGRAVEALAEFEAALELAAADTEPDDPGVLHLRACRANALGDNMRIKEAIAEFEEIVEAETRLKGKDHPDTLSCRNDLGVWLLWRDPTRARQVLEPLLADRLRVLGPDHPNTLTTRGNVAGALGQLGDTDRAIALQRDLLDDKRRVLGPDHHSTIETLANLAFALQEAGRHGEALIETERLVEDQGRVRGADHPHTVRGRLNLATLLAETGRYEEASAQLEMLEELAPRVFGWDYVVTTRTFRTCGRVYREAGRPDDARRALTDFVAARGAAFGSAHPSTFEARLELGTCLFEIARADPASGNVPRALSFLQRLVEDAEHDLVEGHAYLRRARDLHQEAVEALGTE